MPFTIFGEEVTSNPTVVNITPVDTPTIEVLNETVKALVLQIRNLESVFFLH